MRYRLLNGPGLPPALSRAEVAAILEAAFARWASATGLRFEPTADNDWAVALQFGALTAVMPLAWLQAHPHSVAVTRAIDPSRRRQLVTFSDAFHWVAPPAHTHGPPLNAVLHLVPKAPRTALVHSLAAAATHEIGHALGLLDNATPGSVMHPGLSQSDSTWLHDLRGTGLPEVDVAALQLLHEQPGQATSFPMFAPCISIDAMVA